MPAPEPVLICALSGRALAVSARAAGFAPIVLDVFGDLDTRAVAERWAVIAVDRHWRLQRSALLAAAARLAPPPVPLVWGSGFDGRPELLAELAAGRPLWGTAPADTRRAKDPLKFAAAAARLGIDHPTTRLMRPQVPRGWLCKRAGAAGGGHVQRAETRPPRGRGWYWQRRTAGAPVSALVVGDGRQARVLAFSYQWAYPGRRFRFAGAATPVGLSGTVQTQLSEAAGSIAAAHGLVGIGSVDALVAGDRVTLLELNPRPGAALDAYERAYGVNLFRLHRDAVAGRLPAPMTAVGAAGTAILRAPRSFHLPTGFTWPSWAADRTPGGTSLRGGAPVCTVLGEAGDLAAVRACLRERENRLLAMLGLTPAAGRSSTAGWSRRDAAPASAQPGTAP